MHKIFVDTDIIIDYSHGKNKILKSLLETQQQGKIELFVNAIVITEFFTDRYLSNKSKLEKAYELFNFFTVIDINAKTGFLAGELLREKKTDYLGDALIAATCVINSLLFATRNQKHFKRISNLKFYEMKPIN